MPGVITVVGPTGSGKTRLSVMLAKALDGEVVSADSMQIYRGMDIGTAKADESEKCGVVHHMLDIADPSEDYSVARYVEEAAACCDDIISRGKLPVIAGGTGLYVDSLISGRGFSSAGSDETLRESLGAEYDALGGEAMLGRLAVFDPDRAQILKAGDKRRIVRAIEIYMLTGKTITEHDRESRLIPPRYNAARIFLTFNDRSLLYSAIDRRVDRMVDAGLFEEVEALLASGIPSDCTAMQAIGYKEAAAAIRGELSRNEAAELIKQASRRYAKRQITWFSRDKSALRIPVDTYTDLSGAVPACLEFINSVFQETDKK